MGRAPTIFLSAGEPSGDQHGAAVARALRDRWPDARLIGLAGPRMAAAGVEPIAPFDRLAVMGFVEVVRHLPFFVRLLRHAIRTLARERVDLVIPIDYPGFNLRLARRASARGVPVLYYIAPQVWAWHRSRAAALARSADRLAVILPFEEGVFTEFGARVRFVGHPLVDRADPVPPRPAFCEAVGLDPDRRILALFPGSREQEVERHLAPFLAAADQLVAARWHVQPVVALSTDVPLEAYGGLTIPATVDSRALLAHAHAAMVKSGTTTLEAALAGVPMVVAYRTHPLTFWLARRLVEVEHVGLVNLVAGRRVAPELLQDDVAPDLLARHLLPLVDEGPARRNALAGLAEVRAALGAGRDGQREGEGEGEGVAGRVAALAAEILEGR